MHLGHTIAGTVFIVILSLPGRAAAVDPVLPDSPNATMGRNPTPRIVCDQPVYDFGGRDDSETVEHTFVLRNTGTAPLEILKVQASCGCTAAAVAKRIVPPGETTELNASLKLTGRRGEQKKSIRVQSNDSATPFITLWMNGTVVVELALEPSFVNFGQLSTDNTKREMTVSLLSRDPAIEITKVIGESPSFDMQVLPDPSGKKRQILVRLIPPFPKGYFRSDFTVQTTHPNIPTLKLTASAVMPDPVLIMPREILLRGAHAEGLRRLMIVRAGTADELEIKTLEVPDPRITWKLSKLRQGTYRIELENLPVDPALDGKVITIITDVEGYERLDVPIKVSP